MSQHDAPHAGGPLWSLAAVVRPRLRVLSSTKRHLAGGGRGAARSAALGPGAALLVITGFLTGTVVGVTLDQLTSDANRAVQVAAAQAAQLRAERLDAAATERLSGQATAYFARRRTEALDAAQTVVTEAALVRDAAGPVVGPDALGPLDEAVTALAALVGTAPTAPIVLETATANVAAQIPLPEPTLAPVAPTTPGADVLALVAASKGQPDAADEPTMQASPVGRSVGRGPAAAGPDPAAASRATPVVDALSVTTSASIVQTAAGVPPAAMSGRPPLDGIFARAVALSPTVPAADLAAAAAEGLDVTVSNQILGLVDQVRALSVQVRASADAVVAEQVALVEAKAAAQEAARLAATRAARTMRTRIAATDAAPNGEIPTVLLCGVSFSAKVLLRCDAASMLEQMDAAYRQSSGRHLVISSSYRTTNEQDVLRATKGELAAVAGTSNHGRAQAIDLAGAGNLGTFDTPIYLWLVENAGTFGWHHPSYMEPGGAGPLEPWHWEFDTT